MTRILDVVQGTSAWHAERARRFTASEAPAMMGASKYQSRADLIRQKATGIAPEVDAATQRRFDAGHAAEAGARAIVEEMLGEDLYPVTCVSDDDTLLASLDGQTMDESTIFEAKLWNENLVAQVQRGELEPHYYWQLEQELLVSGAERAIFVCSDGTRERFVSMEYRAVPGRAEQLLAGWAQFRADLAAYVPAEPVERVTAAPVESLPAVLVEMRGTLAVHSNLDAFGTALRAFIARIPAAPSTDQEFADTDAACKALKRAEEALEAEDTRALNGMADVATVRRVMSDLRELARQTRLQREKLVKDRKEQLRREQVNRGRAALAQHLQGLNIRLGGGFMPDIPADFAGVISGLKSLDSIRDKIDGELARAKIEANAVADRIQVNLQAIDAAGKSGLFHDRGTLALKPAEDCAAQIASRVTADERRQEQERERIRQEEAEKLARQAAQAAAPAPTPAPAVIAPPAPVSQAAAPSPNVVPMQRTAPAGPPTLKLGDINRRLGHLSVTAEDLRALGFPPAAKDRAAVLFHESDFSRICDSLVAQIRMAQKTQLAA